MRTQGRPKVALVPYPAQGHVTPMVQLASALNRLGFQPVLINPQFIHSQLSCTAVSEDDGNGVMFMSIPDGLDDDQPRDFFAISHFMENIMPLHLDQLLRRFDSRAEGLAFVVVDLLASCAISVAERCRIPVVGFWPAMYATYSIVKAIPDFIHKGLISAIDVHEVGGATRRTYSVFHQFFVHAGSPLTDETVAFLPSLPGLNPTHFPWLVGNATSRLFRFKFWLATLKRSASLKWILFNSFPEENQRRQQPSLSIAEPVVSPEPCLFHVGPLTRHIEHNPSMWEEDDSCTVWLAKQVSGSVIYVSFGSWVGLSLQQHIVELAMALEASERPFLWVLRTAWQAKLPTGFLERVGRRGKVVDWAPQREVLESKAVGCFLTHCGWNSTVEAIIAGKPLLCWPVSGDQFVNCEFIVNVWKVGIQLEGEEREDIRKGLAMKMSHWQELKKNMWALRKRVFGIDGELTAMKNLISFTQAVMNRKA
ncbi:UDP-glycosyltransferase [Nymphaea thermarum]|nr:UDP-glycosyltransferase [Nymphaea thermarum]